MSQNMTESAEEDEDVIIKGSPLYEYLAENGLLSSADDDDVKPLSKSRFNLHGSKLKSFLLNVWEIFAVKWPIHFSSFPLYSACEQEKKEFGRTLFNLVTSHHLLMRDDFVLLTKILEEEEIVSLTSHQNSIIKAPSSLAVRIFGALSAITAAITFMACRSPKEEGTMLSTYFIGASVALLTFVLTQVNPYKWFLKWLRSRMEYSYTGLLLSTQELLSLLHKCLHYIRETEIIDFGVTLKKLLDQRKKFGFSHRDDPQALLCCPDLKKNLALMMREIFFHFSQATQDLKLIGPLPLDFDLDSFYLRHIPLKEFHIGLELDLSIPEQEAKFLEFFTSTLSSNLKTLFDLTLAQISEYHRRLCLCFIGDLSYPKAPTVPGIYLQCHHHLESLIPRVNNWLNKAKVLHRIYATRYTHLPQLPRQSPILQSELASSIHIAYLNLYALLSRVLELEKMEEDAKTASEMHSKMMEIKELFVQIPNLLEHIARVLPKLPPSEEERESGHDNIPVPPPPPVSQNLVIGPETDPFIIDQVFVGTADRAESQEDASFLLDSETITEENPRRIFNDVFQELRSAIAIKAKEHKKREAKALAFAQGIPYSDQEEDSISESESDSSLPDSLIKNQGTSLSAKKEQKEKIPNENDFIPKFVPPKLPDDFSSLIAAMAQQHSQTLGLEEETFSDS